MEKQLPKLGIHDDISNEDYHHGPGISKSGLDLIDRSPAHYQAHKQHPKPSTPAMAIGTALHCLVLEPDKFDKEFVKFPDDAPKRPTVAQFNAKKSSIETLKAIDFWENFAIKNEGKTVITGYKSGDDKFWKPGDWGTIHRMRDAVMSHSIASALLDYGMGKAEQTVYWVDQETKKLCKCRPDFLNETHNIAIDLKTTEDASYSEFARSVLKYRYHVQNAFYVDGLREAGRPVDAFVFIAVEKQPPYAVGVYVLDSEARRVGKIQYRENLYTFAQCMERNEWPAYPSELRDLELPKWGMQGKIS